MKRIISHTSQVIALAIVTILFLGVKMAYGLSGKEQDSDLKLKIEKEWKGNYCGYAKSTRLVIYAEDQWKDVWEKVHALQIPIPELPKIDFEKEMVIAVFMGRRSGGGYGIEIVDILKLGDEIVVEVEEEEPAAGMLQTMAFISPYHIVVVKRSPFRVRFQSQF